MRSTVANFSRAFDRDVLDRDPLDESTPFLALDPMLHEFPRRLRNDKKSFITYGEI